MRNKIKLKEVLSRGITPLCYELFIEILFFANTSDEKKNQIYYYIA